MKHQKLPPPRETEQDWLGNQEAALKMARDLEAYWAGQGTPWVRASVVKVADHTYEIKSNLVNGKPPAKPPWQVNKL